MRVSRVAHTDSGQSRGFRFCDVAHKLSAFDISEPDEATTPDYQPYNPITVHPWPLSLGQLYRVSDSARP